MWSDLLQLIPQNLKQRALDTLVDVVSEQAKKYAGEGLSAKINKLRSDAAFLDAFEAGLSRAMQRFIEEYQIEDEDLVRFISQEKDFFLNKEVQTALITILKQPGAYLQEEREEVVQTFTTVLPKRINRGKVDRAVSYLLRCLAEELWHLPELMPIYSLQFQRITAESSQEQVALQKAQLQELTSLSVGVREALLKLTDVIIEQKLLGPGDAPNSYTTSRILHNLPQPDFNKFIGRETEKALIHRLLRPYPHSQSHLICIDGIGGIGKSTLALEIAYHYQMKSEQMPPEESFDAIIWASAKQDILSSDGKHQRSQILHNLNDIFATISVTLDREDITRARASEQPEVVRKVLKQRRTLLIIDNLETVDDEQVMSFLRELPAPTKAIVTTRHRINVTNPVRLLKLSFTEANELIEQELAAKQASHNESTITLTKSQKKRLYDLTGGIPLALVLSIGQLSMGRTIDSILHDLGEPRNDIALFCFENSVKQIKNAPSYQLLLALSIMATDATREALGAMTKLSIIERDDGLFDLERLSLINKQADRFSMLPLTMSYAYSLLQENAKLEVKFRLRWIDFLVDFIEKQRAIGYSTLKKIRAEIENTLAMFDWCLQQENLERLLDLFYEIDGYLWRYGDWNRLLQYYKLSYEVARKLKREQDQTNLLIGQANIKDFQNDLEEAEICIEEALSICRLRDFKEEFVKAIFRKTSILTKQRQFVEAHNLALDALAVAQEEQDHRMVVRMYGRLGQIEVAKKNYEEAKPYYYRALRVFEESQKPDTVSWILSWIYRWLGRIAVEQRKLDLAEDYLGRAFRIAQEIESQHDQVETIRHIAFLNLAKGDDARTWQFAAQARETFERLGMTEHVNEMQSIIQSIPPDQKATSLPLTNQN